MSADKTGTALEPAYKPPTDVEENLLCVVCWAVEKTHSSVPCGHQCLCGGCAETVMKTSHKCPICMQELLMAMKIFK